MVVKWQDRFVQVRREYQWDDDWYRAPPDNPAHTTNVFTESMNAKTIRTGWLFIEG